MINKALYIEIPIYKTHLFVSLQQSNKRFKKCLLQYYKPHEEDLKRLLQKDSGAIEFYDTYANFGVIRIIQDHSKPVFHSDLAHEIFHYSSEVLRYSGLTLSIESEEAYAYLIGYVTRCIYEHL